MANNTQKTPKEIHIVFQVLNFLHSDHHYAIITCPNEHRVLINLASHNGVKGICPSIPTVAYELKIHADTVRRAIQKWQSLEVVEVERNPGKASSYLLSIPSPTPSTDATTSTNATPCTSATTPLAPVHTTPCTRATLYNKEEQRNNKKAFFMENEKKHDFAESMNQMTSEQRHIEQHEERKRGELTQVAEEHLAMIRQLTGLKTIPRN